MMISLRDYARNRHRGKRCLFHDTMRLVSWCAFLCTLTSVGVGWGDGAPEKWNGKVSSGWAQSAGNVIWALPNISRYYVSRTDSLPRTVFRFDTNGHTLSTVVAPDQDAALAKGRREGFGYEIDDAFSPIDDASVWVCLIPAPSTKEQWDKVVDEKAPVPPLVLARWDGVKRDWNLWSLGKLVGGVTKMSAVDLNRAPIEELESLPGVGRGLAERIVAARPLSSVGALRKVPGIGAKRWATLAPRLRVDEEVEVEPPDAGTRQVDPIKPR